MLPDDPKYYRVGFRRMIAAVVDFGVLLPLFSVDAYALQVKGHPFVSWMILSASALLYAWYAPIGHALFGQTVGKWITGVRVVNLEGDRILWRQAILRDVVPLIAAFYWVYADARDLFTESHQQPGLDASETDIVVQLSLSAWVLLELATMLTNRRRRAIHDFIARTVVIRVREPG